jgi:signal transduction histidine kinase
MNALKHSGVKSFDVSLRGTSRGVQLVVHDAGAGFDTEQMLSHDGIGLISIRERARFVNGKLVIHSKPNAGTTIEVEVPLPSELSQSFASMAELQPGNRAFDQVQ